MRALRCVVASFLISALPTMPGMTETIRDTGKYMTVYVRDADGALKIKVETWNTDMNPMEMGAQGQE